MAEEYGPDGVQYLRDGVTDLDAYADLPEAVPFVESVRAFIHKYGHRGFRYELDFASERLADHPEHILMGAQRPTPPRRRRHGRDRGAGVGIGRFYGPRRT